MGVPFSRLKKKGGKFFDFFRGIWRKFCEYFLIFFGGEKKTVMLFLFAHCRPESLEIALRAISSGCLWQVLGMPTANLKPFGALFAKSKHNYISTPNLR